MTARSLSLAHRPEVTHADMANAIRFLTIDAVEKARHPAISEVQVIGIPDRKFGEQVMAWIKLKPGATSSTEAIREFCQGRIAHFKIPRYVKVCRSLPPSPSTARPRKTRCGKSPSKKWAWKKPPKLPRHSRALQFTRHFLSPKK